MWWRWLLLLLLTAPASLSSPHQQPNPAPPSFVHRCELDDSEEVLLSLDAAAAAGVQQHARRSSRQARRVPRTPFFGVELVIEAAEAVRRAQIEAYSARLAPFANSLAEMAESVRSSTLRERLRAKAARLAPHWQANVEALEGVLLRPFPLARAIGSGSNSSSPAGSAGASQIAAEEEEDPEEAARRYRASSRGYDDVEQVLTHVVRDWSSEGEAVRRKTFQPLVAELQRCLGLRGGGGGGNDSAAAAEQPAAGPTMGRRRWLPEVLVPGAGLGRLALEIALGVRRA
jgi:hypothetical protein